MFHYVYLIRSEVDQKYYVGMTNDLKKRLYSHNKGENLATKSYLPWKLIYFEAYPTKRAAIERERVLKYHGRTFSDLKRRVELGRST